LSTAARDFVLGIIVTIQSPQRFTKFAGSDVNGEVFGNNDRVGIEPTNTFAGDNFRSVDLRFSRAFPVRETKKLEVIAEAFNLLNTTNIRFFNTAYGAADFWPHFHGNSIGNSPLLPSARDGKRRGTA
jgi:hypothetical protein